MQRLIAACGVMRTAVHRKAAKPSSNASSCLSKFEKLLMAFQPSGEHFGRVSVGAVALPGSVPNYSSKPTLLRSAA
jgi:hypothetical protein